MKFSSRPNTIQQQAQTSNFASSVPTENNRLQENTSRALPQSTTSQSNPHQSTRPIANQNRANGTSGRQNAMERSTIGMQNEPSKSNKTFGAPKSQFQPDASHSASYQEPLRIRGNVLQCQAKPLSNQLDDPMQGKMHSIENEKFENANETEFDDVLDDDLLLAVVCAEENETQQKIEEVKSVEPLPDHFINTELPWCHLAEVFIKPSINRFAIKVPENSI